MKKIKCIKCKKNKKECEYYKSNLKQCKYTCKKCHQKIINFNKKNKPSPSIYLKNAQKRAKQKNIKYELNSKWLLEQKIKQNNKCYFSGFEMDWKIGDRDKKTNPYRVSIDRLDSSKGYMKENCVLVCNRVNAMKLDGTISELYKFSEAIIKNKI